MKKMQKMAYKKPQLVAKNNPTGSFAAGCPAKDTGESFWWGTNYCKQCDRAK